MPLRRLRFVLAVLIALPALGLAAAPSAPPPAKSAAKTASAAPPVEARAALLYDPATHATLFKKDPDTPYAPASTVKLLTALIVYETKGLNGTVQVAKEDTEVEPSHIPLIAGETVSVSDLVHALLIGSDNDAAMTLARYTAGSVPAFIDLMNARAKKLGCTSSVFKSPNGLPMDGQQTTANDLLKIFEAAIAVPDLREICETKTFHLTTQAGSRVITNHNKLLGSFPGMGPAKTGWTSESAHTYAASATRNGRELQLIILDSKNKWQDAEALFNYGFAHLPAAPGAAPVAAAAAHSGAASAQPSAAPASAVAPATVSTRNYTVKKGDTFALIGQHAHCTVSTLLKINPGVDPKRLKPGQSLLLPG